ncbi:MAG: hypothetical protein LKI24_15000 [Acidipropionibacterium sp.]|jgi:hypothetical protein|nr:hypothetical protein [Acidipropionibacterium sp.]
MEIVCETNGHGFMAWPVGYDGSFVRGATLELVRAKRDGELVAWAEWTKQPDVRVTDWHETIKETGACVEDGDTEILLATDVDGYCDEAELRGVCAIAQHSAVQVDEVRARCSDILDHVDPAMQRSTFYGDVFATVEGQYGHLINTQRYYLQCVGTDADVAGVPLSESRQRVTTALIEFYAELGNSLIIDEESGEGWTIRKVIRRLIAHDRIHGKAMERMRCRLSAR